MRVRPKPKKEHAPAVIPENVMYPEGYAECFEYRWVGNEGESQSSQWELFNKWTGETIVKDDYNDPSYPESINRYVVVAASFLVIIRGGQYSLNRRP